MMALRAEAILEPIAILSLKKIGEMNKNYVTLSVRRSINMGGLGNSQNVHKDRKKNRG